MNPILAKILLVGLPFVLSLGWFVFWVVKLTRTARKLKRRAGAGPGDTPGGTPPSPPA